MSLLAVRRVVCFRGLWRCGGVLEGDEWAEMMAFAVGMAQKGIEPAIGNATDYPKI